MASNDNRMFIVAQRSKERLELQYIPVELSYSRAAQHGVFDVIGRNIPRVQYTGGTTDLSLIVDFVSVVEDRTDVITNCMWLESLASSDGYDKPQERVVLVFGDMFRKREWVITKCDIVYGNMHGAHNFLPMEARVTMSLRCVADHNPTYEDIRFKTSHQEVPYGALTQPVIIPEIADTTIVSEWNPYANGEIRVKEDGAEVLKRKKLAMRAKFLAQATYRAIVQGESIEAIAYTSLRDRFANAEKYWWILSDLNGMRGDPIDIPQQIGREILIPNMHEVLFGEAMRL